MNFWQNRVNGSAANNAQPVAADESGNLAVVKLAAILEGSKWLQNLENELGKKTPLFQNIKANFKKFTDAYTSATSFAAMQAAAQAALEIGYYTTPDTIKQKHERGKTYFDKGIQQTHSAACKAFGVKDTLVAQSVPSLL